MNDYAFGNFLYELRSEKGLSQSQLGEMLGVTNKAVSKWENGSAKPNTSLIPQIAEILGVTVEELFAGRRFERDPELDRIKASLLAQKKKYAFLSSVFLSALVTLPLLLIEFICIVLGFRLPDGVAGPLGSFGFILAFVVSLVAFIIYRNHDKHAWEPTEMIHTPDFVKAIRTVLLSCAIAALCLLTLMISVYLLIRSLSADAFAANVFLSVTAFVLILLIGVMICFANLKRSLKINASLRPKAGKRPIPFSELPLWGKLCYIVAVVLFPVVINLQIWGFSTKSLLPLKLGTLAIWHFCVFALVIYRVKKK